MTVLVAFKALIASKVVAVGAGTALVAGGLAVTAPEVFLLESASTEVDEVVTAEEEPITDAELVEEPTEEGGEALEEPVGEQDVVGEGEVDPCSEVTGEDAGTAEVEPSCDDGELTTEDGETGEEAEQGETVDDESGEQDETVDERSPTAKNVHRALTATEDNPEGLSPGDEGFGQAVAANARARGGNGKAVSEAARSGKKAESRDDAAEDDADESAESGDDELGSLSSDDSSASKGKGKSNRPAHAGGPKG